MLNINLFGGPSVGKSTTAFELFPKMKKHSYKVEFVPEYAKELTYGKDYTRLADQLGILGEQHHRLFRLANDNIEMIIHDSPFIMGLVYLQDDPHLPKDKYTDLVLSIFDTYENLNIFIERDDSTYQPYGRNQTLEECKQKDKEITDLLENNNIPYIRVKMGPSILDNIYYEVRKYLHESN